MSGRARIRNAFSEAGCEGRALAAEGAGSPLPETLRDAISLKLEERQFRAVVNLLGSPAFESGHRLHEWDRLWLIDHGKDDTIPVFLASIVAHAAESGFFDNGEDDPLVEQLVDWTSPQTVGRTPFFKVLAHWFIRAVPALDATAVDALYLSYFDREDAEGILCSQTLCCSRQERQDFLERGGSIQDRSWLQKKLERALSEPCKNASLFALVCQSDIQDRKEELFACAAKRGDPKLLYALLYVVCEWSRDRILPVCEHFQSKSPHARVQLLQDVGVLSSSQTDAPVRIEPACFSRGPQ